MTWKEAANELSVNAQKSYESAQKTYNSVRNLIHSPPRDDSMPNIALRL